MIAVSPRFRKRCLALLPVRRGVGSSRSGKAFSLSALFSATRNIFSADCANKGSATHDRNAWYALSALLGCFFFLHATPAALAEVTLQIGNSAPLSVGGERDEPVFSTNEKGDTLIRTRPHTSPNRDEEQNYVIYPQIYGGGRNDWNTPPIGSGHGGKPSYPGIRPPGNNHGRPPHPGIRPPGGSHGGKPSHPGIRPPGMNGGRPSHPGMRPPGGGHGGKPSYPGIRPPGNNHGRPPHPGIRPPGSGHGGKPSYPGIRPPGNNHGRPPHPGIRPPGSGQGGKPSYPGIRPPGNNHGRPPHPGIRPPGSGQGGRPSHGWRPPH